MRSARGADAGNPTRQKIVAAAAELFYEKGYHATTTREIAARLEMTAASLYNHFPAKEDILFEITLVTMEELLAGGRAAIATAATTAGQLRRLVEWHVRYSAERRLQAKVADEQLHALNPDRRRQVVAKRDEYEQLFRDILTRGRDQDGWQIDDIPVVTFAIATMSSAVGVWFRETGRLSADAVASIYGDIALRAAGQPQPVPLALAGPPAAAHRRSAQANPRRPVRGTRRSTEIA
jgi:TetR/AcrR family transcriptional regulator, cholesterol catabolism regulator